MGKIANVTYPNTIQLSSNLVVDLPFTYGDHYEGDKIATAPIFEEDFVSARAKEATPEPHGAYAGRDHWAYDGFYDDSFIDLEMSVDFMRRNGKRLKVRSTKDGVEDEGLALLPDRIWGYLLSIHCWGKPGLDLLSHFANLAVADFLRLDLISNLMNSDNPADHFDDLHDLVLPITTKEILMASGRLCDIQNPSKHIFYEASTSEIQNSHCILSLVLQCLV
jgi:hypothetical protein